MKSPFAAQHSLFRAYDIRGARQYFTSKFIQALGKAFAQLYKSQSHYVKDSHVKDKGAKRSHRFNQKLDSSASTSNTVVIGYDVRYGSDIIAQTLADILWQHGLIVINLGLLTTPMVAFWAEKYDGHGIMVTASHSAKGTLGIKWLIDNTSPSGADIQTLYQQLCVNSSQNLNNPQKEYNTQNRLLNSNVISNEDSNIINLPADTVVTTYINTIAQVFTHLHGHSDKTTVDTDNLVTKTISKLNLTIVIDCMNGATSKIAQPLFERFCQHIVMLNDTPDGNFPTGNPDPTEPNRLAELQQTVIINEADIGLAFDGDGDRLMIVDNRGKVVISDHLLYLLAQVALTERPKTTADLTTPQVLFDIKCSHHLPELLTMLGALPVMSRTGSSLMRQQLQSHTSLAIFAGELSGHFIFNDSYFIVYDDAMYAALRLLHWLAYTAVNLSVATVLNTAIDTSTGSDIVPMTTNLWGELRPVLPPYQLTDITHNLPMLVSTADHYLPLTDNANTNCSIVEHLAEFCYYLQHLVNDFAPYKKLFPESSANEISILATSPACACFTTDQHMTKAQAQELLPAGTQLSCIDGVRLDFAHGFGVLRQSNTSHSLTVRFAGDSIANLREVQAHFVALCRPFDNHLAEQIAAIGYE